MSNVNDLVFRWSAVSALGKGWINEELIDKYGLNAVDGIIKWSVEQIRNLPAEVPLKEGQWIKILTAHIHAVSVARRYHKNNIGMHIIAYVVAEKCVQKE